MSSGWDVYYIVFLAALLSLGFPATLWVISFIIAPRQFKWRFGLKKKAGRTVSEGVRFLTTGREGSRRINTRFFLAVNVATILILLALIYVTFLRDILGLSPLSLYDWLLILPFALIAPIAAELVKIPIRLRMQTMKKVA